MQIKERKAKIRTLVVLIFIGLGYISLIYFHIPLTRTPQIDGVFGVLLGLFACAHPAANLLDIVLFGKYATVHNLSRQSTILFWGLNIMVLLVGWVEIVMGLLRFSSLS